MKRLVLIALLGSLLAARSGPATITLNAARSDLRLGGQVTFDLSVPKTTGATSYAVYAECYQDGALIYLNGYGPVPPSITFTLAGPQWTSGSASCRGLIQQYDWRGNREVSSETIASVDFQAAA